MKKKKCSPRKLRRKNPAKRRKNPTATCPECGTGNKDGRDTCWKCHAELRAGTQKPHFGRSLRAPMKRRKKNNKRRHLKRQKRRNKR